MSKSDTESNTTCAFENVPEPHLVDMPTPDTSAQSSTENLNFIYQSAVEVEHLQCVPTKTRTYSELPEDSTPMTPDSPNKIFRTIKIVQNNEERKRLTKKLADMREAISNQKSLCNKNWAMNKYIFKLMLWNRTFSHYVN